MSWLGTARAALTGAGKNVDDVTDRERARMERAGAPADLVALSAEHAIWLEQTLDAGRSEDCRAWPALRDGLRAAGTDRQRVAVARSMAYLGGHMSSSERSITHGGPELGVLSTLRSRRLPWTAPDVAWLLTMASRLGGYFQFSRLSVATPALTAVRSLPTDQLASVAPALEQFIAVTRKENGDSSEGATIIARAQALLDTAKPGADTDIPTGVLDASDPFGVPALAQLHEQFETAQIARTLRHLAGYGAGVNPSKKWQAATTALLAENDAVLAVSLALLGLAGRHHEKEMDQHFGSYTYRAKVFATAQTAALLRAAVWLVVTDPNEDIVALLGRVGAHCGTGLGGSGGQARSAPVTSSAVAALSQVAAVRPDLATPVVAALAGTLDRAQNKALRTAADKALQQVAHAAGLTSGQLLERAVPTFGLRPDGTGTMAAGEHAAELTLEHGTRGARVLTVWRTPAGKIVKTTPAAVKAEHSDVLTQLKAVGAQVKKVAASQRARLEDLLAVERTWPAHEWVGYYPAHPVIGLYARTLIWQARPVGAGNDGWISGLPTSDSALGWVLTGYDGSAHPLAGSDAVRLWHPIRQPLNEVRAWRAHLDDVGVRQPFKQAFREIYLLTPAEEVTATYSNRFAAHILRSPQAGALIRARGWNGQHLGYWYDGYEATATKEVGEDGWRAAFDYALVEREEDRYASASLCATDQVRFERRQDAGWTPQQMSTVPGLVFSEAMRDVDLFVGVTSIAADPTWTDRGTADHHEYWHNASFGDLTESAQMRREALERILPRTTLASRAELEKNFLRVRGHLRDYRIHLGSTNILMSPADTYLCIVKSAKSRDPHVFLPFEEGGGTLSVILSKAFLLADDTSITDPSISAQLRAGLYPGWSESHNRLLPPSVG